MRMPKIVKCASPACNGVARTKGLCLSCAHRKREKESRAAFPVDAPEVPNG